MNEEDTSDPEDNHGLGRISVSLVNNNEYRKITNLIENNDGPALHSQIAW